MGHHPLVSLSARKCLVTANAIREEGKKRGALFLGRRGRVLRPLLPRAINLTPLSGLFKERGLLPAAFCFERSPLKVMNSSRQATQVHSDAA